MIILKKAVENIKTINYIESMWKFWKECEKEESLVLSLMAPENIQHYGYNSFFLFLIRKSSMSKFEKQRNIVTCSNNLW